MFFWKAASFEENLIDIYLKCLSFSQNGDMEFHFIEILTANRPKSKGLTSHLIFKENRSIFQSLEDIQLTTLKHSQDLIFI